jgi:hypothetical protein
VTFEAFSDAVTSRQEPAGLSPTLRALWLDGTGDWNRAHELTNDIENPDGARIHAYLHRKEGDLDNARYWYRQAGRKPFDGDLTDEWSALVRDFLRASAADDRAK